MLFRWAKRNLWFFDPSLGLVESSLVEKAEAEPEEAVEAVALSPVDRVELPWEAFGQLGDSQDMVEESAGEVEWLLVEGVALPVQQLEPALWDRPGSSRSELGRWRRITVAQS